MNSKKLHIRTYGCHHVRAKALLSAAGESGQLKESFGLEASQNVDA